MVLDKDDPLPMLALLFYKDKTGEGGIVQTHKKEYGNDEANAVNAICKINSNGDPGHIYIYI